MKYDIIGIDSLHGDITKASASAPAECRVRVAVRSQDSFTAGMAGKEVEALYTNGPAGGGGARRYVKEVIAIASIFVPEEDIKEEMIVYGEAKGDRQ